MFKNDSGKVYLLTVFVMKNCPTCPSYIRYTAGFEEEDTYHKGAVDLLNENERFKPTFKAGVLNASKEEHRTVVYSAIDKKGYFFPEPLKLIKQDKVVMQRPFPQVFLADWMDEGDTEWRFILPPQLPPKRIPDITLEVMKKIFMEQVSNDYILDEALEGQSFRLEEKMYTAKTLLTLAKKKKK